MADGRRERADAARNRRAILAATERLLAAHAPREVSMEQVAAEAGVGKGTIFHRFGSRLGLMRALMMERAQALEDRVLAGPPPLGPGAPDRDRLLAFLEAVVEVVAGNRGLIAELAHLSADRPPEHPPEERGRHPVYVFWHSHIRSLIAAQRPDLDADMIAHLMLSVGHSEPILTLITTEGPGRLSRTMGALITAVLDAPPAAAPTR